MSTLTRWVLCHKRTVVFCWLVLTIAGVAAAGPATDALDSDSAVPHKEGWDTNVAIAKHYGADPNGGSPLLPIVTLPRGKNVRSAGVRGDLRRLDARLERALPRARVVSYASTGDEAFVSKDGRTTFALVYPRADPDSAFGENPKAEKAASDALRGSEVGGRPVRLTGFDALVKDSGGDSNGPGVLLEAVVGGVGALLVLVFVFASLLAFVPIVMAIVSIMTTLLLLLGLTKLTDVSPIVEFLIALIGLGVAIDYSLLVVSRWREERTHGGSGDDAVQRAMATAGRAVVFSGITVAIGLLALIALPVPFLRSMGYGGVLIPLVSTLVAITLLHVVLTKAGRRLDWPHRRTDDKASRAWTRWAQAVSRRRWVAAGAGMAAVLALAFAATDLRMGADDADTLAKSGDAKLGLARLERAGIGEGALLPHEILVEGGTSPERVARELRKVDGIHGAVAPGAPEWRRAGTALVEAEPVADSGSDAGSKALDRVREAAHSAGPDVRVGGQPAANADFIDAVYGSFPLIVALITVTTFILLARAFRSLLLPAKAILLNILSVAASWGVLVLIWQHGYGSQAIWGIDATGSIPSWMPLMIFAFLFGLSMDYEVFILSRIREEYDRTGSTDTATGREQLARIAFAGTLIAATGILVNLGISFTAADTAGDVAPQVTQTLSTLSVDFATPMIVGFGLMMIASGAVVIRTGLVPRPLGWLAVVSGLVGFTPAQVVEFWGLPVLILILSVGLYLNRGATTATA
jgi:RND superfamily putative drug exporter